jgi:hypothetical protein
MPAASLGAMTRTRSISGITAVLALALSSCREAPLPRTWSVASETDAESVGAAVLLSLYHEAIGLYPSARVACVGVESGDPGNRLLGNLSGRGLVLRKSSRCALRGMALVDPILGADAVAVFVTALNLTAPGEATAEGGYVRGPLAGEGRAYQLQFRLGRWEILDEKATWVS